MKNRTAIVILAAGKSSRIGTPKQLLPWGETTLLGNAIEQALLIPDAEVFVVLGAYRQSIQKEISKYPLSIIVHEHWSHGVGSSIAKAVKEIESLASYTQVLITLADQPFIGSVFLNKLLDCYKREAAEIMATTYKDIAGVPVVFSKKYFDGLKQLKADKGAKSLIHKYKDIVTYCSVSSPFEDVDTLEAYAALKKVYERQKNFK
jgi:molybdenum cofactor cytidylyltransferase